MHWRLEVVPGMTLGQGRRSCVNLSRPYYKFQSTLKDSTTGLLDGSHQDIEGGLV